MRAFADIVIEELIKETENSVCDFVPVNACGKVDCTTCQNTVMSILTDQLNKKYNNNWITDRVPTKEECGEFGCKEFQVTIPQAEGNKTITMDFEYTTIRGKEVARWKWCGRLSPWKVLAWKPLSEPYIEEV